MFILFYCLFFFFNDTATTEIYTLSLHDALPILELVENLKKLVPENQVLSQSALRWVLDFEAVSVVIPGSKNPRQVMDNCAASALPPLTPATHEALSDLYFKEVASHIRGKY